ncbi:hypothetical protein CHU00_11695 [Sphingobacterium cellulitidis]|uniref:hypothetical protein n=1 Tax=Sphingobacterium TaxID=28453 RepID=UPI000B93A7B2|nr:MULTISPECIES: hypothetical protein [Sphingobacterium]OYD45617.1 hypothetical protein CHU00_11695 [Sphingobacterium cellulitidis]WFB63712.1 hypothetical protein PZ892_00560 [Sphingobacterium sp. WM]
MKKLMILGLVAIGFASCSKETLNSAENDIALNAIRTGEWKNVVKTTTVDGKEITDTIASTSRGTYLDFDKDGYAYVYDGKGGSKSFAYRIENSKTMYFDNVQYKINESIIQSTIRFSISGQDNAANTKIEFKRK